MNISNNKNSNNVQNNTEKNSKINTKNKKIIKISTNDTIFGIYNKKFEKHSIPRPNNKKRRNFLKYSASRLEMKLKKYV